MISVSAFRGMRARDCRKFERVADCGRRLRVRRVDFIRAHSDRLQSDAVELTRPVEQRGIAARADVRDDARDRLLRRQRRAKRLV